MAVASRPSFDRLVPVSADYATLPIWRGFDWDGCATEADAGSWYLVCFRSIRQPDADERLLTALDDAAHVEAAAAPGFVRYFKGPLNARGECLSFCLWEHQRFAREASRGAAHVMATSITGTAYATYTLERYVVTKRSGGHAFEFEALAPSKSVASPRA